MKIEQLKKRLDDIEDEIENLHQERSETEARLEELELLLHEGSNLIPRARHLLADSHTEFLCWPEISALEELLLSPTTALIQRVRQILGNHNRLFSPT